METTPGRNITYLIDDLQKNGASYNVWQAIYLGEIISKKLHPDRNEFNLDQKGLKFRPHENYAFPPTDLRSISMEDDKLVYIINFLGLYGINSPLPRCYHEQVAYQQNVYGANQVPLQNFLDIFNDRFYWLYYLAWKKYRYFLHFNTGKNDPIRQRINAFIGIGPNQEKEESLIPHTTLLKFSGFLSNRVRNRSGLLIILSYLFPFAKINVKEFIPKWITFSDVPKLGYSEDSESFRLGENSFIGDSALDYMSRICIEIGPVSYEDYLSFTPDARNARKLKEMLNLYLNDGLEFDVKIFINSETISGLEWGDERMKLGSGVWLGKPQQESCDVYYTYEEYVSIN